MTQNPPIFVPSRLQPLVDEGGRATEGWWGFFSDLVAPPSPLLRITVTASPFTYTAVHAGHAVVVGGVVSSVGLKRGRVIIPSLGLVAGPFPVSQDDQLIITYTGLPVLWFVPNGNPA